MSKGYKTLSEIKSACKAVDSCAAGSDGFMYKCFPYMMECLKDMSNYMIDLLREIKKLKKGKVKRNPSEYNLHMSKELKEGKTFKEAVESWNSKKE